MIILITVILILTGIIPAAKLIAPQYVFVTKWSIEGYYKSIANDNEGNVYILDMRNNCIEKFDSDGKFITKWGDEGEEDGQFSFFHDLFISDDNIIYVADTDNNRIQEFDCQGNFITKWTPDPPGKRLFDPHEITEDLNGNFYITPGTGIDKFNSNKELIGAMPSENYSWEEGSLQGYVDNDISDIILDRAGNMYFVVTPSGVDSRTVIFICDEAAKLTAKKVCRKNKVEYMFRLDSFFYFAGKWYEESKDDYIVGGIAITPDNYLIGTDYTNGRINTYDSSLNIVSSWGGKGSGNGQFNRPGKITIDKDGNLYVIDSGNHRIQKFAPNPDYKPENLKKEE